MDSEIIKTARLISAKYLALRVAVTPLLRQHPDRQALLAEIDSVAEGIRAKLLTMQWSDQEIEDFEKELASISQSL